MNTVVARALLVAAVLGTSVIVSFGAVTIGQRAVASGQQTGAPSGGAGLRSGDYLVAYVMVSSGCGACREPGTRKAVLALRDSLRSSNAESFARIAVVGVAIEGSVGPGIRYLQSFGAVFDEVSVGGAWLNQIETAVVWRNAFAKAQVPQVVLVVRKVDARGFPRDVSIGADSLLFTVSGRDSLVQWVNGGARIPGSRAH
jgi:hypothetical protein